jgi:hypothetical protein
VLHFRHFSREEANALRPWVAERIERLREARDRLASSDAAASLAAATAVTGGSHPGNGHARAAVVYALTLEEFEERDIVVRDLDRGLVDFPAMRDGREVYLCWVEGEDEIGFWHDLDAGYGGRQPL